jgi:NAD+ synthase
MAGAPRPARLHLALAQINPTVGDVPGNLALIRAARAQAAQQRADLVLFPELVVVGYPPEDLVLRPSLVEAARRAIEAVRADTTDGGPAVVVSAPWRENGELYNAVMLASKGDLQVRFKHELPNYGVFDEKRVFCPGPLPEPVTFNGISIGLPICEDVWEPAVATHLASRGAELLLVPNGSPFEVEKAHRRESLAAQRVNETGLPLVYLNQVGGQDELVFDGASFVTDRHGRTVIRLAPWDSSIVLTKWCRAPHGFEVERGDLADAPGRLESVYQAMMLGLRDYVDKNGFTGIVLGMSGGIDSALSAAVAVDALGAERVHGVRLPSRFTSDLSLDDAAASAQALGMRLQTIAIEPEVEAFERSLAPAFTGRSRDITEENLQARVRGVLLMALSNKFGWMVLTTGNKSEMSVGYATLYGDMCGGYSVLKDVYKTEVYGLARWRNMHHPQQARGPAGPVVPETTITRPPSAELRPDQTDQDSLPSYDQLDAVLERLIEDERGVDHIVAEGFPRDLVMRVQHLVYVAEYKRRQAPPGVKISRRSFGRDRRYPLTNRFRDE